MKVKIDHDGVNVHLLIEVESSRIAKVALFCVLAIGFALLGIAIAEWLLGLLIAAALWLALFGWISLWNLFGKELLIINTKSLSYQHTYGFYVTPLETKRIYRAMNISLIPTTEKPGKPLYNLVFESFNSNDLPEELYRTALPITAEELEKLKSYLRRVYIEKVNIDFSKQPHLLN
jgi:hypothetical protein